jgi:transcriptional regulator with XRE-family HTH domain
MPVDDIGKIINRQIGARLRNARTRRGLSQDKLGHALGVTFQQVQKYENGSNGLVAAKLSQLADILGVTVNYFYDAPDGAAPELPRLSQKFMRLIQNLQRIVAHRPATFLAICEMAATLAQASPLAASTTQNLEHFKNPAK